MAIPVIMPRQGQSVESCIISEWFVKKGDSVKEGDLLFSYETDKAAFEEDAKSSGTILAIFYQQGDDVPVLTNVCIIGEAGEDYSALIPGGASVQPSGEEMSFAGQQEAAINEKQSSLTDENETAGDKPNVSAERFISPRARSLAEKTGADIRFAVPTGPNGRMIERDVRELQQHGILVTSGAKDACETREQSISGTGLGGRVTTEDLNRVMPAASQKATAAQAAEGQVPAAPNRQEKTVPTGPMDEMSAAMEYQDARVSNIRKVIARSMHESLSQMAQLTLNTSFDATEIMKLRSQLKAHAEKMGLSNITLNDILIFAVSRILPLHKAVNAHFLGDTMRYFTNVNMGIAVDTDRGLMVPTLFNANLKSLNQISIEAKQLAQECQKGTINPDKLKNGTFTITNLGALGIESFTPVINPPQTAILGVNTIVQKFREGKTGIEAYSSMSLSLTFDHRAVDGAPAARFLKDLTEALESFTLLIANLK